MRIRALGVVGDDAALADGETSELGAREGGRSTAGPSASPPRAATTAARPPPGDGDRSGGAAPARPRPRRRRPRPGTAPGRTSSAGSSWGRPAPPPWWWPAGGPRRGPPGGSTPPPPRRAPPGARRPGRPASVRTARARSAAVRLRMLPSRPAVVIAIRGRPSWSSHHHAQHRARGRSQERQPDHRGAAGHPRHEPHRRSPAGGDQMPEDETATGATTRSSGRG